jgi:twitching motility protein PilT
VAAFEIMTKNSAVENHIRKSETFKITSVIQTSRRRGMVLMDDFIIQLVRDGVIGAADALAFSQNPGELNNVIAGLGEDA